MRGGGRDARLSVRRGHAGGGGLFPATAQPANRRRPIGPKGAAPGDAVAADFPTLNQNTTGTAAATVESFTVGTGGVTANTVVITDSSNPAKIVDDLIAFTGSAALAAKFNLKMGHAVNTTDGQHAAFAQLLQRAVVVPATIAEAMPGIIECQQRHQHHDSRLRYVR